MNPTNDPVAVDLRPCSSGARSPMLGEGTASEGTAMTASERCDEILRLIDEVLGDGEASDDGTS